MSENFTWYNAGPFSSPYRRIILEKTFCPPPPPPSYYIDCMYVNHPSLFLGLSSLCGANEASYPTDGGGGKLRRHYEMRKHLLL